MSMFRSFSNQKLAIRRWGTAVFFISLVLVGANVRLNFFATWVNGALSYIGIIGITIVLISSMLYIPDWLRVFGGVMYSIFLLIVGIVIFAYIIGISLY